MTFTSDAFVKLYVVNYQPVDDTFIPCLHHSRRSLEMTAKSRGISYSLQKETAL